MPYFDKADALQRVRNNEKLLFTMLKMFLDSKEPEKLRLALAEQDYTAAAEYSHAIKGIAANLSLTALYEAATGLNNELKEGSCSASTVEAFWPIYDATVAEVNSILAD